MATVHVVVGGDLQAAINAASPGDIITLAAGGYYEGNFTLPNKGGVSTSYITIRSNTADGSLPATGYRMFPSYASLLPRIRGTQLGNYANLPVFKTANGAKYWKLMFLEIDSNFHGQGELLTLGINDNTQTEYVDQPNHIVVDRCYLHGHPVWGQKRAISCNGKNIDITNNYINKITGMGQDAMTITGYNGEGPLTVINNYLEAAAENIIIGGDDPQIRTIATVLASPAPTTTTLSLSTGKDLSVGQLIAVLVNGGLNRRWPLITGITAGVGTIVNVTFAALDIVPDQPGDARWGINLRNFTFRRNHVAKQLAWRNPILPTPTGLAAVNGGVGTLPSGTFYYSVQAIANGYSSSDAYSAASTPETSITVGASSAVNLSWSASTYGEVYRLYRRNSANQYAYKETTSLTLVDTGTGWTSAGAITSASFWVTKCLFELKQGQYCQIDSNVFENHWKGSDVGQAIWIKNNNQGLIHEWPQTRDIVYEKNMHRHVFGFMSVSGSRTAGNSPADFPEPVINMTIRNNLVYDSNVNYSDGGYQYGITIANGSTNIVFDHNTIVHQWYGGVSLQGQLPDQGGYLTGLTFTNNMIRGETYAVKGSSNLDLGQGSGSLDAHSNHTYVFSKNVLANAPYWIYPAASYYPDNASFEAEFKTYGALGSSGDFRLKRISEGDAVNSAYINLGTDGKDIGCDIPLLLAAIDGVVEGLPEGMPATFYVSGVGNAVGSSTVLAVSSTTYVPTTNEYNPYTVTPNPLVPTIVSWMEWSHVDTLGNPINYLFSKVALVDPLNYYGGFKEARVLSWGKFKRALSDYTGHYEAAGISWTLSDTDHLLRRMLGSVAASHFQNRMVVLRMADDISRRAGGTARTVARGIIRNAKPVTSSQLQFSAEDFVGSKFSAFSLDKNLPQRTINRTDFPSTPVETIGLPVPVCYGNLSDEGSGITPPYLSGNPAAGAFTAGGYWTVGWGNLPNTAALPMGVSVFVQAGLGSVSGDVPSSTYGIVCTSVDVQGKESDANPYFYDRDNGGGAGTFTLNTPTIAVNPDGTDQILVNFTKGAGAVTTRVYLGYYYYGFRFVQYIETNGTSVTFDRNPSWTAGPNPSNISIGAKLITWGQIAEYAVSATMVSGETGLSAAASMVSRGFRRPARVQWVPIAGALGYNIYRRPPGGQWDHKWTVGSGVALFDDDWLDTGVTYIEGAPAAKGVVPVIYVGQRRDSTGFPWEEFVVCGHAVKTVTSVFQNSERVDPALFGITWLVPGKTGFTSFFSADYGTATTHFHDNNNNRYTTLYVRGPDAAAAIDGSKPITLNLSGIETIGNGDGAVITDLFQQYKHFMINWGLQTYKSGGWLSVPTYPADATGAIIPQIDENSFQIASDAVNIRYPGGYPGAFIIGNGDFVSLRDVIAQFNTSCDCDSGFTRGSQYFVSVLDVLLTLSQIATKQEYSQSLNVFEQFDITDAVDKMFNVIPYAFAQDYVTKEWGVEGIEIISDRSITNFREVNRSSVVELNMIRIDAVAQQIIQRKLNRLEEPPRIVTFSTSLVGLNTELGDIVLMTHTDGLGSLGNVGWVKRTLRVLRHELDLDKLTVTLECQDVARLMERALTTQFVLGNDLFTPVGERSWLTASPDNRAAYGYLANEATGIFSDGAPGKTL